MGLYRKRMICCGLDIRMSKTKTKFAGKLAEPSDYTGGTRLRVPSDPLGQLWIAQKIH